MSTKLLSTLVISAALLAPGMALADPPKGKGPGGGGDVKALIGQVGGIGGTSDRKKSGGVGVLGAPKATSTGFPGRSGGGGVGVLGGPRMISTGTPG